MLQGPGMPTRSLLKRFKPFNLHNWCNLEFAVEWTCTEISYYPQFCSWIQLPCTWLRCNCCSVVCFKGCYCSIWCSNTVLHHIRRLPGPSRNNTWLSSFATVHGQAMQSGWSDEDPYPSYLQIARWALDSSRTTGQQRWCQLDPKWQEMHEHSLTWQSVNQDAHLVENALCHLTISDASDSSNQHLVLGSLLDSFGEWHLVHRSWLDVLHRTVLLDEMSIRSTPCLVRTLASLMVSSEHQEGSLGKDPSSHSVADTVYTLHASKVTTINIEETESQDIPEEQEHGQWDEAAHSIDNLMTASQIWFSKLPPYLSAHLLLIGLKSELMRKLCTLWTSTVLNPALWTKCFTAVANPAITCLMPSIRENLIP